MPLSDEEFKRLTQGFDDEIRVTVRDDGSLGKRVKNEAWQRFREERVEVRKDYTDACVERGADDEGIAKGTNWIYRILFGTKPEGNRDQWTIEEQSKSMLGEHQAANRIRDLPTPPEGSCQRQANDAVVEASKQGAHEAKDMIEDKDSGGWAGWLWNHAIGKDAWGNRG